MMVVVGGGKKYRQLAANILAEGGNSSPALAERSLLIRTASTLYRFNGESEAADS